MKKNSLIVLVLAIVALTQCVQKSKTETVVVKLNVAGMKDIQSVGIRGNEKPLGWDYDMELKPIVKDSLYTATFSLLTGYKFTEVKFTVNGQFELNDKSNRRISFSGKDTTVYEAKFDVN
jgi:putative oxidoreductase